LTVCVFGKECSAESPFGKGGGGISSMMLHKKSLSISLLKKGEVHDKSLSIFPLKKGEVHDKSLSISR